MKNKGGSPLFKIALGWEVAWEIDSAFFRIPNFGGLPPFCPRRGHRGGRSPPPCCSLWPPLPIHPIWDTSMLSTYIYIYRNYLKLFWPFFYFQNPGQNIDFKNYVIFLYQFPCRDATFHTLHFFSISHATSPTSRQSPTQKIGLFFFWGMIETWLFSEKVHIRRARVEFKIKNPLCIYIYTGRTQKVIIFFETQNHPSYTKSPFLTFVDIGILYFDTKFRQNPSSRLGEIPRDVVIYENTSRGISPKRLDGSWRNFAHK